MNLKSTLALLTFLLSLMLNGCGEGGATADLSWVAPTERVDGSALSLSDIAGYRIYYGHESGVYHNQIDVNDHTATQAQLPGLPSGKYFIALTTIDTDGRESAFSQEVEKSNYER
ncbi:MAG: fibronectin type III domain-containing protein [Gammaproteobacteria bacterium]|jgi:hypothetical protein